MQSLINGFGRIIKYDKDTRTMLGFREGQFSQGSQVGFGRYSLQQIDTDSSFE